MGTPREERLANNEALFREGNERMAAWEERLAAESVDRYLCECADTDCREKVALSRTEYQQIRSNSCWFVAVPGHEVPDVEIVIETHDGWVLIEKDPEVAETVQASDPRRAGNASGGA